MKVSKMLIRVISVLLIVTMIAISFGLNSTANNHIYYSDLFFGYDPSYLRSQELADYHRDTSSVLNQAYSDFCDSDSFTWMQIKESIHASTDLVTMLELLSDAYGDTRFSYYNALDKANEAFAKALLSDSAMFSSVATYGTAAKIYKKAKDITKLYKEVRNTLDLQKLTYQEIFAEYFAVITDEYIYESLSWTEIQVFEEVLPNLEQLGTAFSTGADVLEAAGAISLALLIEDVRMDLIDDLMAISEPGMFLYDGMERLKEQLSDGWVSYFLSNYAIEKVISELGGELVKAAMSSVSAYALVTSVLKVASWVVFDVIMGVPDLEDFFAQNALQQYVSEIYTGMLGKIADFGSASCDSSGVPEYENLFTAYIAAVNAGLSKSESLLIASNGNIVTNVKAQYSDLSYDTYIEGVKDHISGLADSEVLYSPITERSLSLPCNIYAASDDIEPDAIYTFKGKLPCSLILTGWGTINTDCSPLVIDGNLTSEGHLIFNESSITVNGNATFKTIVMTHEIDYMLVNGDFTIGGIDSEYYNENGGIFST
ncbi:MAG: hypothetical protein K6G90_05795, partial [Clostridia bacterium]|nr:hypothetical protein [Clostridia bacterium]